MEDSIPAVAVSERVRTLSSSAFNSTFRVEIAMVILTLDEVFTFDELWEALVLAARESSVEPPSQSKARGEVARLREIGALERMPRPRGTLTEREVRRDSTLWTYCQELHARAVGG